MILCKKRTCFRLVCVYMAVDSPSTTAAASQLIMKSSTAVPNATMNFILVESTFTFQCNDRFVRFFYTV